ncbi:hypothetical protein SUGI_0502630 [Cryptomeria japonica]|nr:hypothetical protein SUGI_0502630 [Cryptomeria japonica]
MFFVSWKCTRIYRSQVIAVAQRIRMDRERFKHGKELYKRIGRSWKRGCLLHGPPGTGKSSIIAAIANHMKYDVYDLEPHRRHCLSSLLFIS